MHVREYIEIICAIVPNFLHYTPPPSLPIKCVRGPLVAFEVKKIFFFLKSQLEIGVCGVNLLELIALHDISPSYL